jgi:septum site-determining protein MinC
MTSDSALPEPPVQISSPLSLANPYSQVRLKSEGEKLLLILPSQTHKEPAHDWSQVWQELKYCLKNGEHSWRSGTAVYLNAQDRLLDGRQLQAIAEALGEADLQLKWIGTSRRQTAVAGATAGYSVEQTSLPSTLLPHSELFQAPLADPLYLKTTVRSGIEIHHPGTVIVLGDLNPGGKVVADGDILILGCLRGIAHAGAQGNPECLIMALRMEPTQLRISDIVARAPASSPEEFIPEVAYITQEGIRIAKAINFSKIHTFVKEVRSWTDSKTQLLKTNNQ